MAQHGLSSVMTALITSDCGSLLRGALQVPMLIDTNGIMVAIFSLIVRQQQHLNKRHAFWL